MPEWMRPTPHLLAREHPAHLAAFVLALVLIVIGMLGLIVALMTDQMHLWAWGLLMLSLGSSGVLSWLWCHRPHQLTTLALDGAAALVLCGTAARAARLPIALLWAGLGLAAFVIYWKLSRGE